VTPNGSSEGLSLLNRGLTEPSKADPAAVRRQLERILRSETLVNSERLCRFLRVAVERTLAGETDKLKEWVLAQDVFDRDESYDPRIDSIVRVEARRLRAKLRQYYEKAGPDDSLLIWFRTGSYTALFQEIAPAQKERAAPVRSETPPLNPRTVAVLPFVNLSPEPGQDFFCDGITEELLNELTTIPDLNVVARTSVFHFKGRTGDVREIGERLGAGTVIEGSVRKSGSHLRIAAKAIDAATGCHLWSGTFDRQMVDVFAVQDEIARAVGNSLRVALAPSPHAQPHEKDIAGLEAYTLYLKGRH
jgi:adenylate cyclase